MGLIEKLEQIKTLVENGAGGGSSEDWEISNCAFLCRYGQNAELFLNNQNKLNKNKIDSFEDMFYFCFDNNYWGKYNDIEMPTTFTLKGNFPNVKTAYRMFFQCKLEEVDLSELNISNCTNISYLFGQMSNLKKVYMPKIETNIQGSTNAAVSYLFYSCSNLSDENIILETPYSITPTNCIMTYCFSSLGEKTSPFSLNMFKYFNYGGTNSMNTMFSYPRTSSTGGVKDIYNIDFSYVSNTNSCAIFGTSTTNSCNKFCHLVPVEGSVIGVNTAQTAIALTLNNIWRGSADSIPNWDTDGWTLGQYFEEFANALGTNESGYVRQIKIYTNLYNTLSDEQKAILTNKNYTITYG